MNKFPNKMGLNIYSWVILFFTLLFSNLNLLSQQQQGLEKVRYNLSKGNKLIDLFPDSAVYYYQNGLNIIKEVESTFTDDPQKDSISFYRIVLLSKIGNIFHDQSKYSLAYSYYKQALDKSNELKNDSLLAESEFILAEVQLENGSYVDAIDLYTNAIEHFDKIGDKEGVFWSNIGIGIVYRECGSTKLSKIHYENAKKIGEELNDKVLIGVCNNNLGNLYRQIGEFKISISYLESALKYFEELGKERYISDVLESIGDVYREYGDHKKSLEYYKRSTEIAESLGDNYRLFSRYSNLANSFSALDKNDDALMYMSKALKLAQTIGDKARMSEFYIQIADFYHKNNDTKNAQLNLDKALTVSKEIGDTVSIASALTSLAKLHYLSKDYKRAFNYAASALKIAKQKDLLWIIKDASYYLSKISEKQNRYKNAYNYHTIYQEAKDSLLNAEKIKILEETEAKYNLEKLENEKLKVENAALTAEKKIARQKIFIGLLGIILVIGGGFFGRYFYKKQKEKKEETEKSGKLKRRIDLLNNQLNAKNRELTSKALLISNSNRTLEEAVESIDNYLNNENPDKKELRKLKSHLQGVYEEKSWEDFLKHFEDVHPNFYKNLTNKYPDLSAGELKICAFLRMNLNTKEISNITNQTLKSIEVARTRIRKKLGIDHSKSLTKTIQSI